MLVLSRYRNLYYIDQVLSVPNLISFGHKTNVSENSRLIRNFSQETIFLMQWFRFVIFMEQDKEFWGQQSIQSNLGRWDGELSRPCDIHAAKEYKSAAASDFWRTKWWIYYKVCLFIFLNLKCIDPVTSCQLISDAF